MVSRSNLGLNQSVFPLFDHFFDAELRSKVLRLLKELLVFGQFFELLLRLRYGNWPINYLFFLLLADHPSPTRPVLGLTTV